MSEIQEIIDQYLQDKRNSSPNYGVAAMKSNGGWDFLRGAYNWTDAQEAAQKQSMGDQLSAVTHRGKIIALYRNGKQVYLGNDLTYAELMR